MVLCTRESPIYAWYSSHIADYFCPPNPSAPVEFFSAILAQFLAVPSMLERLVHLSMCR